MVNIDREYPIYNWSGNKGYPSRLHRERILIYGISPYHRKTFNLTGQLKIPF
jgi:ribonuclease HII